MNTAIHRAELRSSTLARAEYNANSAQLVLDFHDGSRYAYSGFPTSSFNELLHAPSQGTFFNREIRNRYPYVRIS
jgi:hypothetical protein